MILCHLIELWIYGICYNYYLFIPFIFYFVLGVN